MDIQKELSKIISDDHPDFWVHALAKVIRKSELDDEDFHQIIQLLKKEYKLIKDEEIEFSVLECQPSDLISSKSVEQKVNLKKIYNVNNINALSSDSEINFSSNSLNIVYGDNGAGKSGYARILREICRFRGARPKILKNIFKGTSQGKQSADIKYVNDGKDHIFNWIYQKNEDSILKNISVFDRNSATKYIEEKNEVAFRPFVLKVLDDFARSLDGVRNRIETMIDNSLERSFIEHFEEKGNDVSAFIFNLSKDSDIKVLEELTNITKEDEEEIERLEVKIGQLKAKETKKRIKELGAKQKRIENLKKRIICLKFEFRNSFILSCKKIKEEKETLEEAAELASSEKFEGEPLSGVGTNTWLELWNSAKKYSTKHAYPNTSFPFIEDESRCVFCQQSLGVEAKRRIKSFDEFVKDDTNEKATKKKREFDETQRTINSLGFNVGELEDILNELEVDGLDNLVKELKASHTSSMLRKEKLVEAYKNDSSWEEIPSYYSIPLFEINKLINNHIKEIEKLQELDIEKELKKLEKELQFLKDRKTLKKLKDEVKKEIERKEYIHKLNQCKSVLNTRIVTTVSNNITETVITKRLHQTFESEIKKLGFSHFEIIVKKDSGSKAVTYHKLKIKDKEHLNIANILSEGEYRCIALAHFLSELLASNNKSGIVFDDPVSSLDHRWTTNIASRLVQESEERQVVVFTHDLTFLKRLIEFAEQDGIETNIQSLDRKRFETGIAVSSPPWYSQTVKKRIGELKQIHQALEKSYKEDLEVVYRSKASDLYGKLRETWEALVEQLLLNRVVERFGRAVQTKRLRMITDISDKDILLIDSAMAKCSQYLTGHDESSQFNDPLPLPDEIRNDISLIEDYRKALQTGRKRG